MVELRLAELKVKVQGLLDEQLSGEEFYRRFSYEVHAMTSQLGDEDLHWFEHEIALMLAEHGRSNR
jgi:hypothetical protein